MSFKRSLFLILTILFLFLIFASGVIYSHLREYQEAITQQRVAEQIIIKVFERKTFGDEYLQLKVERARNQWFAKQKEIKDLVNAHESILTVPEQGGLLSSLRTGLDASDAVMKEAVESASFNNANEIDARTRFSNQLTIRAQETISYAKQLEEDAQKTVESIVNQLIVIFSAIFSLFVLLLAVSVWIIWRNTSQIAESNERFNLVAKATNDAIYDWDLKSDGNGLYFSDGMESLFGYSKSQIVSTLEWWSDQLHPEDKERVDKEINEIFAGKQISYLLEYRFKRADGSYAYVEDRAYLVRDIDEKPIRYVGVMHDVSQSKKYEIELKKRTDEAEKLNRLTVDRELKMIELKKEIAELKKPATDKMKETKK